MASIENSLKHEAEVGPGKIRLITSGEFVRAYNHSETKNWRSVMRMRKSVVLMAMAFSAMFGHAGDSAPFVLDNATSPSGESVVLPWNAEWIGGNANATVVITDNGTEVKRATGIGEFTLNISCGSGNHQLEYSTFIGGIKQGETYTAEVELTHIAVETKVQRRQLVRKLAGRTK